MSPMIQSENNPSQPARTISTRTTPGRTTGTDSHAAASVSPALARTPTTLSRVPVESTLISSGDATGLAAGGVFVVTKLSLGTVSNRNRALWYYNDCAEHARKNEPGVLMYFITIPRDDRDDTSLYVFQHYATHAAATAHFQTPLERAILGFLHSDPGILAPIIDTFSPTATSTRTATFPTNPTLVYATIEYAPEMRARALRGWAVVAAATAAEEPGALSYSVLRAHEDRRLVGILEMYESERYLFEVHAASTAVVWNRRENGGIRRRVNHVRLRCAGGFVKR